jgi:ankyrin repeat protein
VHIVETGDKLPLHKAVASANPAVLAALIAGSASVNAADYYGRTPLHDAAAKGDTAAMTALLAAVASVNAEDNLGNTPLHVAMERRQTTLSVSTGSNSTRKLVPQLML